MNGTASHSRMAMREDNLARQSDVTVSNQNSLFTEYKGFFINVISSVILVSFIIWGLTPTFVFEEYLQFDYFPDKYWFIAIPSYSLILMVYIYVALAAYNTEIKTMPLNDVRNFVDEFTVTPNKEHMEQFVHKSPSGVCDLPLTLVNEVLYNDEDNNDNDHNNDDDSYEID